MNNRNDTPKLELLTIDKDPVFTKNNPLNAENSHPFKTELKLTNHQTVLKLKGKQTKRFICKTKVELNWNQTSLDLPNKAHT